MKFGENLAHKWLSTKLVKKFDFFFCPSHQIQAQKIHFLADLLFGEKRSIRVIV